MLKLVQTTVGDHEQAERLARKLIDARLAACVQMLPVTSLYHWQGALENTQEILLLIKTTEERVDALRKTVEREHPYEVPEITTITLDHVSAPYAAWAVEQTTVRK